MANVTTSGTNGGDLLECPHCGSVAEYVSEHAKGRKWAVACTMTSRVAADEGRPMCRCRTPFFRDKGQARDIWNRRAGCDATAPCNDSLDSRLLVNRLRCIADDMRGFGASTMTPHDVLAYFAGEVDKAADMADRTGASPELVELAHSAWSMALCAMQGMPIPAEWGEYVESGLRGHGIDVDDEKAAFEEDEDDR